MALNSSTVSRLQCRVIKDENQCLVLIFLSSMASFYAMRKKPSMAAILLLLGLLFSPEHTGIYLSHTYVLEALGSMIQAQAQQYIRCILFFLKNFIFKDIIGFEIYGLHSMIIALYHQYYTPIDFFYIQAGFKFKSLMLTGTLRWNRLRTIKIMLLYLKFIESILNVIQLHNPQVFAMEGKAMQTICHLSQKL